MSSDNHLEHDSRDPSIVEAFEYSGGIHEGFKNDGRTYGSFYPQDNVCRFCNRELKEVFSKGIVEYDPENRDTTQDVHHTVSAKSCECGWWTVEDIRTPDAHNLYASTDWVFCWRGVLRRFSLADDDVAIESIRRAIVKRPGAIDVISPRKMEELVGAVMRDFWPGSKCMHCGRTGDGGLDLLLVVGDRPCAIQVKHRQNIHKAEAVHYVTHFIGALMVSRVPRGVFVTSADHFSKAAEAAAASVLESGTVESFQLIARRPFLDMLEATTKNVPGVWRQCIPDELWHNSSGLTPYSICLRSPER